MAEGGKREPAFDIRLVAGPVPYEPPPLDRDGGGENSFLGRTRAELHATCGELRCLRYEAKESMARKLLLEIAREVADKHGLLFVRMVHALGEVPVGEASILCQVVSAHRKETFEATAELMNKLKSKVPIWKQEVWENGETWQDGAPIDPKA